jgi:hypothetical protein
LSRVCEQFKRHGALPVVPVGEVAEKIALWARAARKAQVNELFRYGYIPSPWPISRAGILYPDIHNHLHIGMCRDVLTVQIAVRFAFGGR